MAGKRTTDETYAAVMEALRAQGRVDTVSWAADGSGRTQVRALLLAQSAAPFDARAWLAASGIQGRDRTTWRAFLDAVDEYNALGAAAKTPYGRAAWEKWRESADGAGRRILKLAEEGMGVRLGMHSIEKATKALRFNIEALRGWEEDAAAQAAPQAETVSLGKVASFEQARDAVHALKGLVEELAMLPPPTKKDDLGFAVQTDKVMRDYLARAQGGEWQAAADYGVHLDAAKLMLLHDKTQLGGRVWPIVQVLQAFVKPKKKVTDKDRDGTFREQYTKWGKGAVDALKKADKKLAGSDHVKEAVANVTRIGNVVTYAVEAYPGSGKKERVGVEYDADANTLRVGTTGKMPWKIQDKWSDAGADARYGGKTHFNKGLQRWGADGWDDPATTRFTLGADTLRVLDQNAAAASIDGVKTDALWPFTLPGFTLLWRVIRPALGAVVQDAAAAPAAAAQDNGRAPNTAQEGFIFDPDYQSGRRPFAKWKWSLENKTLLVFFLPRTASFVQPEKKMRSGRRFRVSYDNALVEYINGDWRAKEPAKAERVTKNGRTHYFASVRGEPSVRRAPQAPDVHDPFKRLLSWAQAEAAAAAEHKGRAKAPYDDRIFPRGLAHFAEAVEQHADEWIKLADASGRSRVEGGTSRPIDSSIKLPGSGAKPSHARIKVVSDFIAQQVAGTFYKGGSFLADLDAVQAGYIEHALKTVEPGQMRYGAYVLGRLDVVNAAPECFAEDFRDEVEGLQASVEGTLRYRSAERMRLTGTLHRRHLSMYRPWWFVTKAKGRQPMTITLWPGLYGQTAKALPSYWQELMLGRSVGGSKSDLRREFTLLGPKYRRDAVVIPIKKLPLAILWLEQNEHYEAAFSLRRAFYNTLPQPSKDDYEWFRAARMSDLTPEKRRMVEAAWKEAAKGRDGRFVPGFTRTYKGKTQEVGPFEYQSIGGFRASMLDRAIIGDAMGLGKTLQAIAFLALKGKDALPALVVAPANVTEKWAKREIPMWSGGREITTGKDRGSWRGGKLTASTYHGGKLPDTDVVVVSWNRAHLSLRALQAAGFKTVIGDEVHYAKNAHKTARGAAYAALAHAADYSIQLSGTLLENKPVDLYGPLFVQDPVHYSDRSAFAARATPGKRVAVVKDPKTGESIITTVTDEERTRAVVMEELQRELVPFTLRRLRENVPVKLPEKRRTLKRISLSPRQKRVWEDAKTDGIMRVVAKNIKRMRARIAIEEITQRDTPLLEAIRLANMAEVDVDTAHFRMALFTYLRGVLARLKTPEAIEWIKTFRKTHKGEPLVVWAWHKEVVSTVAAAAKKAGLTFGVIDGSVSAEKRRLLGYDFQQGKYDLMICSSAAREGLDLTRAAHALFVERMLVPSWEEQAEDRIARIGQEAARVHVHLLHANDTLDDEVNAAIESKREFIDGVLGLEDTGDLDGDKKIVKSVEGAIADMVLDAIRADAKNADDDKIDEDDVQQALRDGGHTVIWIKPGTTPSKRSKKRLAAHAYVKEIGEIKLGVLMQAAEDPANGFSPGIVKAMVTAGEFVAEKRPIEIRRNPRGRGRRSRK